MKPKPDSFRIRADFNDRLHSGEIPDLPGYKLYLNTIHHNLQMYLTSETHSLRSVEGEYFDHLTERAGEQKSMIDLLDEYIGSLPPDPERKTGEQTIASIKNLEEEERRTRGGNYNPYYGVLIAVT